MKIPKRIQPDRIRDAIVELRYVSKVPYEVVVGMFFQALGDTYNYTNRPIEKKTTVSQMPTEGEITIRLGGRNLFFNDNIKIELRPNFITFNCMGDYITWSKYSPEISNVLTQFLASGAIECFKRIGVRYISDYEKTNLTDCVNFDFTFGMPDVESLHCSFNTVFMSDDIKVVLNLGNNIPRKSKNSNKTIPVSSIDVDTILDVNNVSDLDELMELVNKVHHKEKEMFFTLLKPEFLKSLNPEY